MKPQSNPSLLAQAIRVYLTNQRQGTKHAKTRGEVAGSGKKIWRQKGTGNARHGDRQAPLFVGGGIAHGPKGQENYRRKLPKKMKGLALKAILQRKKADKQLVVVKDLTLTQPKTKVLAKLLEQAVKGYKPGQKLTLVTAAAGAAGIRRAGRNLAALNIIRAQDVNPYQLWRGGTVVMSQEAKNELK
jgi:large subunit ribosomal protein L4